MKRAPLALAAISLISIGAGFCAWATQSGWAYVWLPWLGPAPLTASAGGGWFDGRLLHVADGDTVVVRYHDLELPVRLLNIDTPESAHPDAKRNTAFGREVSAWAKDHLAGATVRVEFQRRGWRIATDGHQRALAYLWIDRGAAGPDDSDELYNETVIRRGFSRYETEFGPSPRYHRRLDRAQADAERERLGRWRRDGRH